MAKKPTTPLPPVPPLQRGIAPWQVAGALAALAAVLWIGARSSSPVKPDEVPSSAPAGVVVPTNDAAEEPTEPSIAPAADAMQREQTIDDPVGKLLWASPTAGAPISLAYAPTGAQCLIYLRPAQLAAHPEGEKIFAALGPWGTSARAQLESLTGAKLEENDAVLATLIVTRGEAIDVCLRVELHSPWDDAELARRHPQVRAEHAGKQAFLVDGDRAWFLASKDGGSSRTLVGCPKGMAQELIDSAGDQPLLGRDIESLVAQTDGDRTATVIIAAKFFDAGGSHALTGAAEPLRDAVASLLGNDATAAALSVNWSDSFFVELRASPALTTPPKWLATVLPTRIAAGTKMIDGFVTSQAWTDYGRAVVERFPAMLEKLVAMTRHAEADKQAVVRAYLPAVAGHNLLMGAELLLTQATSGHAHGDEGLAHKQTLDQRLATVTSLSFPKETLQRALELLSNDIGVPIEIDGGALRLEGITQNQSFKLDLHDQPAAEILVAILRLANPDRTAESPADPRQKLVYVIEPAADGGGRMIVTTRAAAEKSGRPLPAAFSDSGG